MKKIVAILVCFIMSFCFFGCTGGIKSILEKDTVLISVYNGGFGVSWANEVAQRFMAEPGNQEKKVKIVPTTEDNALSVKSNLDAGTNNYGAYFYTQSGIRPLIEGDYLIDLADDLDSNLVGESVTAKSKFNDYTTAKNVFGKTNGEGMYGIPYADGIAGLIFDYEIFKSNGWLVMDGDSVHVGKDGKAGTYDDGQPQTMAQWNTLVQKISSKADMHAFIFTTQFPLYLDAIMDTYAAQYGGIEEFETFLTFDGNIKNKAGQTVAITPNEGYKAYDSDALYRAATFFKANFCESADKVHPLSFNTATTTHKVAQNNFVTGNFKPSSSTPFGGMLIDGIWWENEATSIFKSLEARGEADFKFGIRDYRFMLLPKMDGQKGIDGEGNGSVITATDTGCSFAVKTGDAKKDSVAKEFLLYTLKTENLQTFTTHSGAARPFKYDLTTAQYGSLTKFAKNAWDLYHDTENVAIVRPNLYIASSPIYSIGKKEQRYNGLINSVPSGTALQTLSRYSVDDFFNGMITYNSKGWGKFYEAVKHIYEKA